jgi:hypothetical protein
MVQGGILMDNNELFKNVLEWSYHHCRDLWNEFKSSLEPEKRQHVARKILIEKVRKEPATELLISPDLKKKILIKEGVDLKRIDAEYQEKKEPFKDQQETKIDNQEQITDSAVDEGKQEAKIDTQEPGADSDIDEDEVINVKLSENLSKDWSKFNIKCILFLYRKEKVKLQNHDINLHPGNIQPGDKYH